MKASVATHTGRICDGRDVDVALMCAKNPPTIDPSKPRRATALVAPSEPHGTTSRIKRAHREGSSIICLMDGEPGWDRPELQERRRVTLVQEKTPGRPRRIWKLDLLHSAQESAKGDEGAISIPYVNGKLREKRATR
jgi:hypothetical protein